MDGDARPTILVVDDEPAVLDLLIQMLDFKGFDAIAATDGDEALALAQDHDNHFDLVILDLHLPGKLTGLKTYEALRKVRASVPVVLVSGNPHDPDLGTLPKAPVIAKPFTADKVANKIRELLGIQS